jgi:transcriptional regulator GlxA family with amidase domain
MRTLLLSLLLFCRLAIAGEIPAYTNPHARAQPVIAVVGYNGGTELTDFVIPYGVLARSGAAELISVATQTGPMTMRPALRIQPHDTISSFDSRFPDGADYVIVPAVVKPDDATLIAWVAAQGAKGATIVSICDGALVVANAGLFKGRRATAHWATGDYRRQHYPDTEWLDNVRYVSDGRVISSAGVSAAMPTALALVEAIAGKERATAIAQEIGVSDWSTTHDSDIFHPRLGVNLGAYLTGYTNQWFHSAERIGVPIAAGVDEITLAFTADAWARSKRNQVYTVANSTAALSSAHGLTILPDYATADTTAPALLPLAAMLPGQALDRALEQLAQRYGHATAFLVALELEYPSYR